MSKSENIQRLHDYLKNIPNGSITEESELTSLLVDCWTDLAGAEEHGTKPEKLWGRMENLIWKLPILSFTIERHGGTVLGSTRADLHEWSVDVKNGTASCNTGRFRQLQPSAHRLDVKPIVEQIVKEIDQKSKTKKLKWLSDTRVRILVGELIPNTGFKATVAGRRKRFSKALEPILASHGWFKVQGTAPHTYELR